MTQRDAEEEARELARLRDSVLATSDTIRSLHRRAEEQLVAAKQALEERTRQLGASVAVLNATLESSPDGIIAMDLSRRIIVHNARFAALAGIPEPLLAAGDGAAIDALMLDQVRDRALLEERIGEQEKNPEQAVCDEIAFRDGRVFERYATPQFIDARCTGVVVTWREVTIQKRDEIELTRLNRAFRMLSRCNAALVRARDEDVLLADICRIAVIDGGYRMAWVGYAQDDARKSILPQAHAGAELGYLAEVSPSWAEDNPDGQGTSGHAIRSGRPVVIPDIASAPGLGRWRQLLVSRGYGGLVTLPLAFGSAPTRPFGVLNLYTAEARELPTGELALLVDLASDLAFGIDTLRTREQRRRVEEQVIRLNAELEDRVRRRTVELETAYANLESFSYSVAHDLRAPLRTMSGFAQLVAVAVAAAEYGHVPEHMERIQRSAARMNALIDGLLAVSRAAHGRLAIERVDLAAMIEEVLTECRAHEHAQVDVGPLPAMEVDAVLMRQVWTNLISNAVKYSAKRSAPKITILCDHGETEAVISVADNGAGFDQRFADKLFGVFQRLHRAAEFEGSGIGLAIVRRIVERHGGRVWAEGQENVGATFHVALPLQPIAHA